MLLEEQVERMRFAVAQHFPSGTRVTRPQGGFVLWVELPRGVDSEVLLSQALTRGVSITPGVLFSTTRKFKNFIRISCGLPWSEDVAQAQWQRWVSWRTGCKARRHSSRHGPKQVGSGYESEREGAACQE
jgi:hypothetical protein